MRKAPELKYETLIYPIGDKKYKLLTPYRYYSKRYDKYILLPIGMLSDGATGAMDIHSWSWWVHDKVCETGLFEDGTKCNNWQASRIIADILWSEWSIKKPLRGLRAVIWLPATWLFGGGKCRDNGMFNFN